MHIFLSSVARTIIILIITDHALVAAISRFVPKTSGVVAAVNPSDFQASVLSQKEHRAAKYPTNTDDKSTKNVFFSDKLIHQALRSEFLKSNTPINVKLYTNSGIRSGSENRRFSFLLDSDKNIKHNNKMTANKNIDQATKTEASSTSDMITNADVKVLQKFVKKLKKSVTDGEKGQALRISSQQYSKLAPDKGDNKKLNKWADTQSADSSFQQPNVKNTYDDRKQRSSDQSRIFLNINKDIPPNEDKEGKAKVQTKNNLNDMSKSDVEALLAIAKEWKRLHSEGNEMDGHSEQLSISNEKGNHKPKVNKQSKGHANFSQNHQGNQKLISRKKVINKTEPSLSAVNKEEETSKDNSISIVSTTDSVGTKLTNEIPYYSGQQLKDTVDKAIANTTQQLLQFIKLEKQLVGIKNGSFANDNHNEIHYTDAFINLINAMRNSKNFGVSKTNGRHLNSTSQNLSVQIKNKKSNSDRQAKMKKPKSFNHLERASSLRKNESKQKFKVVQNKITEHGHSENISLQQGKMNKSELQQLRNAKLEISYKLKQNKNVEQHTVKTAHKVKYKHKEQKQNDQHPPQDGQIGEQEEQAKHKDQEEPKNEQQKQEQQEKQQEEKEHEQNQVKEAELSQNISQNSGEKTVKDEFNTQTSKQENINEQKLKSQNTSNDDVLRTARHFRIKTMKHLIASLAEDPFDTWIYHQKSFDELGITPTLVKAGIVNLGSSKPMQRALRKAVLGKNIKMLVVGGSISAGGGLWKDRGNIDGVYHRALARWWERAVTSITKSKIEVNNVAIGGTDSEYFSYCINNFLESNPDVVLWELSANDYNRFNERNFDPSKPLEQLTRIILQLPSHPALIYVNFFRGDKQNFELGEKCPDSEETEVDILSRYYDIPSLSWRRMVCNLITKRTFVNQELFGDDGYHPNLLGHAQVAMLLMMYVKGVFESVLADDLDRIKKFNILNEGDSDFEDVFQLKIPAFKDPLNPKPSCWTLITPDYRKVFRNTLNEVNVLRGEGFELRNVTAWDVRTDRIQCLFAMKPGAILDLSLDVPVLDDDRNLPLADAQTRTLAIAIHNKFGGAADVQLDQLPSKTSVAYGTGKLRQTKVHIVSEDVRPGVHNLRFRSLSPGFCLTSIMVI